MIEAVKYRIAFTEERVKQLQAYLEADKEWLATLEEEE
jgi:hypothetical protein